MPFKFIHTADIHLDSPLKTLALCNPELSELIGNATRQTLGDIVTLCLDESVDALLIAGDLYDGSQTSMKTALFLAAQMRRLDEAGILTFVIRGNHDAMSTIPLELTLPDSVTVFSGRAHQAISLDRSDGDLPVTIHGVSFSKRHAPDSLLPKYRAPVEGAFNIAMMHTSLDGAEGHDLYAPCKLSDLQASGHQYWALGHIHKRQVHASAGSTVVMPGIPQGRDIGEDGIRSVTVVTCTDDGQILLEERSTSRAQFERVTVNIDGMDNRQDVIAAVTAALRTLREKVSSPCLVARVRISGRAPVAWVLRRDADVLKGDLDIQASMLSGTWVEKIELHCQSHIDTTDSDRNALTELEAIVNESVLASSAFEDKLDELAMDLKRKLPPECRDIFGTDEESARGILRQLAHAGAEDILARLYAGGTEG